jgi:hypothetical protein
MLVWLIGEQYDSRMKRLLAASLLLLGSAPVAAQESDRSQIRLDQSEYVWDVRLHHLESESPDFAERLRASRKILLYHLPEP